MVELVWAPPELWTIPVPGSGLDVESDYEETDDPPDEDVERDDSSDDVAEPDEELVESGSANAVPGVGATAVRIPSATAKAPTRPMYLALR
jgi:hypothetical protein